MLPLSTSRQPMRILSPCQAAALLASPVLCLWELPGCQPQGAVAVPLTTRALGALYLGAATLYLRGGRAACAALAALLLLPCAAAGVRCCKRRRVPAEQF